MWLQLNLVWTFGLWGIMLMEICAHGLGIAVSERGGAVMSSLFAIVLPFHASFYIRQRFYFLKKKQNTKFLAFSSSIEFVWRVSCFSNTTLPKRCGCFNTRCLKESCHLVIFKHSTKSTRLWNQFAIVANSIPTSHDAHWPQKNSLIRLGCIRGKILAWIM